MHGGTKLAWIYAALPPRTISISGIQDGANIDSNRAQEKIGTNLKKEELKSDKLRFFFSRNMSVDGMMDALKDMTVNMDMKFVPDKKLKRTKPTKKEIRGGKRV